MQLNKSRVDQNHRIKNGNALGETQRRQKRHTGREGHQWGPGETHQGNLGGNRTKTGCMKSHDTNEEENLQNKTGSRASRSKLIKITTQYNIMAEPMLEFYFILLISLGATLLIWRRCQFSFHDLLTFEPAGMKTSDMIQERRLK